MEGIDAASCGYLNIVMSEKREGGRDMCGERSSSFLVCCVEKKKG